MVLVKKFNISICILLALLLFYTGSVKAQCAGCTTVITSGASNFSVNPGQVVCIASDVTYTGNITLNGGVLCNQGTLTRVVFKKGTFNNYGTFNKSGSLTISNNGNLFINCYAGSTFSIASGLSLSSVNIEDSVVITNNQSSLFTTGTGLSMHNTNLTVYNGSETLGLKTIFNVGAQLSMGDSSNFKLRNFVNGNFNIAGNLGFNSTGNKSIVNNGIFNVNNSISMSGNANPNDFVTIINNGNFNVTGNISAALNNASVLITNNAKAILSTGISLTLSKITNTLINNGEIIVGQDLIVLNGAAINGGLIISSRDIKINNGSYSNNNVTNISRNFVLQTNANAVNTGNIVAANNFQITSSSFINLQNALAVASVSANIQSTSTIMNNGTIITNGDFKIVASYITNSELGVINTASNCIFQTSSSVTNNGTVTVGTDLRLTGSIFNNNKQSSVSNEFLITGSSQATNNGTISVISNIKVTTSTLTNNSYLKTVNNFSTTNASAIINNNAFIEVSNEFKNIATINLGEYSTLKTGSYYNVNNGAINGTGDLSYLKSYPRIIISGFSQNSGYLNQRIVISDETLEGTGTNNGFGFDQVSNPARIAISIIFAKKGTGIGNPPAIDCNAFTNLYSIATDGTLTSTCPANPILISSQAQQTIAAGQNTLTTNLNLPTNSYTWQPGNLVGQSSYVYPTVTTTYTVYATLANGCIISNTLIVNVNSTPPTIQYNTIVQYPPTASLTFPVTQTGPTGGTYTSTPALLSLNPTTGLITAGPLSYGTYTIYYTTLESQNCYSLYTATTVVTLSNSNCFVSVLPDVLNLCIGDQIQLTATGGVDGYTWTPIAGLSCTNCSSPILTFSGTITQYTVSSTNNGTFCGQRIVPITQKTDCEDNSIVGCCFSNYGVAVYVNDANTHINVYCNVLNEVSNLLPGPSISKGKFESYGYINFTKDWIHNGQNTLYTTANGTTTTFGNIDQNLKGNSNTHFNKLVLGGNGLRTIWINEYANSDLDLTSNEFSLQNFIFFMKNPIADIFRTSGFASTHVNGYFSRYMNTFSASPNKAYLFPLGTKASTLIPFRYRPIETFNNSLTQTDEVSANFMNISPSLATDVAFVNTNFIYTNTVTLKAPSISQVNSNYYHKLKNTVLPAMPSNLIIKYFYPPVDGSFQSISEWEKNNLLTLDWWGTTPGASANNSISTNAGTFGQKYAMSNGPFNFDGKPFSLAISNIYVNTSSFAGSGNVITLTPAPTNTTIISTNTTVANTATTVNTTTTTTTGGVTTSTTSSTTGTVTTITTNTTTLVGGVTTSTSVVTTGTIITITTSSTSIGAGGITTNTTSSTTGTLTSTTTSTTSPTVGGISSTTISTTSGGTTVTTVSITVNNGNSSTNTSTVTTVVGNSTVVVTQTCVTIGIGNSAITTCSTQTNNNPITVTTVTTTSIASNSIAANTYTNVYNPGPFAISPNPIAGDYILNIASPSNCDIPGQVKFTVTPSGSISTTNVLFSPASSNAFSVNLSEGLYTIDNVNVSLTLNSTPTDVLASCTNSILIQTSVSNDYIISNAGDILSVNIPNLIGGFSVSTLDIYDYNNLLVNTPQVISIGQNNPIVTGSLIPGVYEFQFTLTLGAANHLIKGQFIKL